MSPPSQTCWLARTIARQGDTARLISWNFDHLSLRYEQLADTFWGAPLCRTVLRSSQANAAIPESLQKQRLETLINVMSPTHRKTRRYLQSRGMTTTIGEAVIAAFANGMKGRNHSRSPRYAANKASNKAQAPLSP